MPEIWSALLSVHPCDFLEMSNENSSWNSCHCIREGEYRAGTLSYMNDGVSMIFYTVDEEVTEHYYTAAKITRQVFCYENGILMQSRLYPQTDYEQARNMYRDIVQRTIALCIDQPNLWKLKKLQDDVDNYCGTHENALHYTDYTYNCYKSNISILESTHDDAMNKMLIGNTAYCLECSQRLHNTDSLYCYNCGYDTDYITCDDCGTRIERDSDDDYYVNGGNYCRNCVTYCDHCHEYTRDELTEAIDQNGNHLNICSYCRNEHYFYCEDCEEFYYTACTEHIPQEIIA